MVRFLVKRTLRALIALYLFITFVFFFTQLIIPGDFTTLHEVADPKLRI